MLFVCWSCCFLSPPPPIYPGSNTLQWSAVPKRKQKSHICDQCSSSLHPRITLHPLHHHHIHKYDSAVNRRARHLPHSVYKICQCIYLFLIHEHFGRRELGLAGGPNHLHQLMWKLLVGFRGESVTGGCSPDAL